MPYFVLDCLDLGHASIYEIWNLSITGFRQSPQVWMSCRSLKKINLCTKMTMPNLSREDKETSVKFNILDSQKMAQ